MHAPARTVRAALTSILLTGLFAACCGYGVFGAFSGTTANGSNDFSIGTVTVEDNDTGTALYSLTNVIPDEPVERCIRVTYTGSLGATLKMYRSSLSGTLGPYVTLNINKGTGTDPACSDFAASSTIYDAALSDFPETYGTALALTNGLNNPTWSTNNARTYRVRVTVQNNPAAANKSTGTHSFTWQTEQV